MIPEPKYTNHFKPSEGLLKQLAVWILFIGSELVESIHSSKFYNSDAFVSNHFTDDMYIESNGQKAVWARTENGYIFQKDSGNGQTYTAKVDTIKLFAEFIEGNE